MCSSCWFELEPDDDGDSEAPNREAAARAHATEYSESLDNLQQRDKDASAYAGKNYPKPESPQLYPPKQTMRGPAKLQSDQEEPDSTTVKMSQELHSEGLERIDDPRGEHGTPGVYAKPCLPHTTAAGIAAISIGTGECSSARSNLTGPGEVDSSPVTAAGIADISIGTGGCSSARSNLTGPGEVDSFPVTPTRGSPLSTSSADLSNKIRDTLRETRSWLNSNPGTPSCPGSEPPPLTPLLQEEDVATGTSGRPAHGRNRSTQDGSESRPSSIQARR